MQRSVNEYDILKSFAIILVVIGHITILFTPEAYPHKNVKLAQFITFGIYLFHMPLFMSISGAVYQLSQTKPKYRNFKSFILNKVKRILVPYFLVGLLALLPVLLYLDHSTSIFNHGTFLKILLAQDCRHLWYLLALFWIFMFQYICDKLKITPSVTLVFSICLAVTLTYLTPDFHFLCIEMAIHYWPYFIMGIIMEKRLKHVDSAKSIIISILGSVLCAAVIYLADNLIVDIFFSLLLPCFICVVLINTARLLSFPQRVNDFVRIIAGYSFGIYLFHIMVIYLLRNWLEPYISTWILMGLLFLFSIGISMFVTWLLKITRLKFIIGE